MKELSELVIAARFIGGELKKEGRNGWYLWQEEFISALEHLTTTNQSLMAEVQELRQPAPLKSIVRDIMNLRFKYLESIGPGGIYQLKDVSDITEEGARGWIQNDCICFMSTENADHACCVPLNNILLFADAPQALHAEEVKP